MSSNVTDNKLYINHEILEKYAYNVFKANGLKDIDAKTAAFALIKANLRGIDSHGIARLTMYCERLRRKVANPNPDLTINKIANSAALIDGDNGLGLIIAPKAIDLAVKGAKKQGIYLVGVKNSGHFGMAALYLMKAIQENCAALIFTNSSPSMPVWGGRKPFVGTSPFGFAIPTPEGPPFILDMAMSIAARGKLKFAAQRGEEIPEGLALDGEGRPTRDGKIAFEEGVMLPFGGVKGACMSLMMDVLGGVFTGSRFGGETRCPFRGLDRPQGVGHVFIAFKADLFMSIESLLERMGEEVSKVKNQPPAQGFDSIMCPGEPEQKTEVIRRNSGIPLTPDIIEALKTEGKVSGVEFFDC